LKASTLGNWIHESLTEFAKRQLRAEQEFIEYSNSDGNPYYDGPSYFYAIAELVDPDNGQLIETVRTQLRDLNVKDFGFSIIQMLAEFKNLQTRIGELGGTYNVDDQFLDFWACLCTMQEKEFARYVRQERDAYRKLACGNRGHIKTYMRDMCDKEVAMKADNKWNVMSAEDAMVISLVNALEAVTKTERHTKKKTSNESEKDKSKQSDKNDKETDKKRREDHIPEWKKISPKEGEPITKEVHGKTYHWCSKYRDSKGPWALHKEEEHRTLTKSDNDSKSSSVRKNVSFIAAVTGEGDNDNQSTSSEDPKIQVNPSILKNAKAYLAKFQDFQQGGSQD
jgi:hypothetical protein